MKRIKITSNVKARTEDRMLTRLNTDLGPFPGLFPLLRFMPMMPATVVTNPTQKVAAVSRRSIWIS